MLESMGFQRVGYNSETKQQQNHALTRGTEFFFFKVVNDLVFSGSSDQSVHAHNIHVSLVGVSLIKWWIKLEGISQTSCNLN